MPDVKQREIAESVFDRTQRREAELNDALAQEAARRAAVVKNIQRLSAPVTGPNPNAQTRKVNIGVDTA
jgi:hypothetical protein